MKRVIQAILIVTFILAFGLFIYFFARMRQENLAATLPVAGRVVEIEAVSNEAGEVGEKSTAAQRSKINLEWDETLLDVVDMNLDEDEDLEQILIVKPTNTQNGRISIVIADFLPNSSSYFRLWKGETLATKPNAVVVQPKDLLADGSVDLFCYGIDEDNRQTLTVFKRPSARSNSYYTAFSESGLSISFEEPAEAEVEAETGIVESMSKKTLSQLLAELLPKGKEPILISVYVEAPGGASPLDQKRIMYSWNHFSRKFERGAESFVPGGNIEQLFINRILTGQAEDFDDYLKGLWIKEDEEGAVPTLVFFDPEGRKISLHSEQEQQQWDWGRSNAAFAGIYAPISNSAVPDMIRLLGIDLVGLDKVRIRATAQQIVKFAMKEDWNGVYRRPSNENTTSRKESFKMLPAETSFSVGLDGGEAEIALRLGDFDGFYASENGMRLDLIGGKFRLSLASQGFFTLFQVDDEVILDLSLIDDKSIPSGRLSYMVKIRLGKNNGISTLILQPAQVLSDRVERLYQPDILLRKLDD